MAGSIFSRERGGGGGGATSPLQDRICFEGDIHIPKQDRCQGRCQAVEQTGEVPASLL